MTSAGAGGSSILSGGTRQPAKATLTADQACAPPQPLPLLGQTFTIDILSSGQSFQQTFLRDVEPIIIDCWRQSADDSARVVVGYDIDSSSYVVGIIEEFLSLNGQSYTTPACSTRITLDTLPSATFTLLKQDFTSGRPVNLQVSGSVLTVTLPPYTFPPGLEVSGSIFYNVITVVSKFLGVCVRGVRLLQVDTFTAGRYSPHWMRWVVTLFPASKGQLHKDNRLLTTCGQHDKPCN